LYLAFLDPLLAYHEKKTSVDPRMDTFRSFSFGRIAAELMLIYWHMREKKRLPRPLFP